MAQPPADRARVIANIDPSRVEPRSSRAPMVGDIVVLDQGTTGPNGEPMGLVYCMNPDGSVRWGALVFDSEIELLA
jgi:hypothetical protein